ncbi:MAG: transporter substrate-binding domain-containing protein [Clostridia bacterium]|nr:transporter substrate-binding domain-containing protein [Clostridia bacterium]
MKFTKILALVLAFVMLFAFASCGTDVKDNGDENKGAQTTDTAAGTENKDDEQAPAGTLKMATNAYFAPYEYYDGETIVGIDAEIAAKVAEKLGMTLEIVDMQFDSILTAVQEGSVDFGMAGMTVNETRLQSVDFTISYANGVQAIIVKEGSAITTADDLYAEGATYKVGVQLGTTGDTYCTGDFGDERVVRYANGNEAVLALASGSVDCVIIDNEPAKNLVAANEGLTILETEYTNEDYAICVAKGNQELLNKLNTAIDELIADGTVKSIIDKYIPAE